jgi:hypothetical protein
MSQSAPASWSCPSAIEDPTVRAAPLLDRGDETIN